MKVYKTKDSRIVIKFPPDFDGELHIDVVEAENYFEYSFRHNKTPGSDWECLVKAAMGIIAQNDRLRVKRANS